MVKTIIIIADYITLEQLTTWIRSAYRVVLETDKLVGKAEIKRTLKVVDND